MTTDLRARWHRFREHIAACAVVDGRALALGRIGLGVLILYDLLARAADIEALYSDAGLEPRSVVNAPRLPLYRLYFLSGSATFTATLFALNGIAALALLIGYRTRAATVVAWVMMGALQARNSSVLQGGDDLLQMLLLWGIFLPLGAFWSVDARRKPAPSTRFTGSATFALYGQLFMLYFVTGTLKVGLPHWRAGDGIYDALSADHFVSALGLWLYPHAFALKLMTWGTLLLEVGGPLLFFVPPRRWRVRLLLVVSFIVFHLTISAFMRIGLFSFVCVVAWLFLIPGHVFDRFSHAQEAAAPPANPLRTRWTRLAVASLFGYLVLAAMVSDRWPHGKFRDAFLWPLHTLDMQESWGMFVKPRTHSGWFAAKATTQGPPLDLIRGGAPFSLERPTLVVDLFANQRWRKMLTNLTKDDHKPRAERYLKWLCQRENSRRDASQRIRRIGFIYVKHEVRPSYRHGPDETQVLATVTCPQKQNP